MAEPKRLFPPTISSPDAEWTMIANFKEAMRRTASTVCVLTTVHDNRRWGLTATAVCSLSVEPPSLIVCVNRLAEAHVPITESCRIGVNFLAREDVAVAQRFSGAFGDKGEARFTGAEWFEIKTGVPLLQGALAALDCRVVQATDFHTHSVLFAEVRAIVLGNRTAPLIYANRSYLSNDMVAATAGSARPD